MAEQLNTTTGAQAIESLLSDSGDFLGEEAPPAEPQEAAEEPDQAEDAEEEVEAQADEAEPEHTTGEAEEGEAETEEAEEELPEIATLADVAKALDVDVEELTKTLTATTKVNGEVREISLADALAGHQKGEAFEENKQRLKQERDALHQQVEARERAYQQRDVEIGQTMQAVEALLKADLESPGMQELRTHNPAEWGARSMELQNRLAQLGQIRQAAANEWAQRQQDSAAEQEHQRLARLAEQEELLTDRLASQGRTWNQSEKAKVADFLTSRYGYTTADISNVSDHRAILMALDAMGNQAAESEKSKVREKIAKMPKMQKPGKSQPSKQTTAKKRIAGLKGRLKQTGNVDDAAKVIEALM